MKLKKGWFGYINLGIGTIIMSVYLYTLFVSLYENYESVLGYKIYFCNISMSVIISACLLILVVGLFFLISFIKSKIIKNSSKTAALISNIFYWLLFVAALIYGTYKRFVLVFSCSDLKLSYGMGDWQRLESLFYGNYLNFDNIIERIYSICVVFLYKIFGDILYIPAVFNVVLYVVSALLIFLSVKYIFGKLPALFSFAGLLFCLKPTNYIFDLNGFNLWFFISCFIIFLFSYFMEYFTVKYPVTASLIFMAVFFFVVALNNVIFVPFEFVFIPDEGILLSTVSNYYEVIACVVILALYGYLSFIYEKHDRISLLNVFLVILLFFSLFDYSNNHNYVFYLAVLFAFAGMGVRGVLLNGFKNLEEGIPVIILEDFDNSTEAAIEEPKEESKVEEPKAEEPKTEVVHEEVKEVETVKKVKLLDNPLPLPKKHVKKNLEFNMEPSADDMKFDVEISENDDFDI